MAADDSVSSPSRRKLDSSEQSLGKFCLGIVLLLVVVVIDAGSAILYEHVFGGLNCNKPYLSTYLSISMFSVYLVGFLLIRNWRKQCFRCACDDYPGQYLMIGETDTDTDDGVDYRLYQSLGQPSYAPTRYQSDLESDAEPRRVKFNELIEVRHLEDTSAARIARMPHLAALRAKLSLLRLSRSLSVGQIARLSCVFALVAGLVCQIMASTDRLVIHWSMGAISFCGIGSVFNPFFAGNVAYAEALLSTDTAVVDVLSSSCSIFTLLLSAVFPLSERDRISVCKVFAVLLCVAGAILVCISAGEDIRSTIDAEAFWAVFGAVCYAVYVVLLRRIAGENLNIVMFLAFVGLFTFLLLWPGMLILHYTKVETFEVPSNKVIISLVIHGLIGTVVAEALWLWGCFLTSPVVATMGLTLKIPITVAVGLKARNKAFSWRYFAGAVPLCFSFVFIAVLSFYDDLQPCCTTDRRLQDQSEQEIPLTALASQSEDSNSS